MIHCGQLKRVKNGCDKAFYSIMGTVKSLMETGTEQMEGFEETTELRCILAGEPYKMGTLSCTEGHLKLDIQEGISMPFDKC